MKKETVLESLTNNLFHPRMTNNANSMREQRAIQNLRMFVHVPGYTIYMNWEGSTAEHIRFRAEHVSGISVFVHVYPETRYGKTHVRVTCTGPHFHRKWPLAHSLANRMLQPAEPVFRLRKRVKRSAV